MGDLDEDFVPKPNKCQVSFHCTDTLAILFPDKYEHECVYFRKPKERVEAQHPGGSYTEEERCLHYLSGGVCTSSVASMNIMHNLVNEVIDGNR